MKTTTKSSGSLQLKNKEIGKGFPPLIIAEIGQSHDGSLGVAHSFIDAVAESGADCIKFQTHFSTEESTYEDEFRVNFSEQDKTRFDYWRRMEFLETEWKSLADHASKKNLIFLSSAFSVKALRLLIDLGVPAIKIASGEASNYQMLNNVIEENLPVILSTGMSSWSEIKASMDYLNNNNIPVIVLQCTSEYPTPLEHVGLNVLDEFNKLFPGNYLGLSDHSGSLYPSLAAIARGIDILEVHVTFDRRMFGPDTIASITIDELRFLSEYRDAVFKMDSNPVDKDKMAKDLSSMRELFFKSLAPARDLKKGTVLTEEMLKLKKPGTGIKPDQINDLIGKRLNRDVTADHLLKPEDFEGKIVSKSGV